MSSARKINDHSGFPGKGGSGLVLPVGNKLKSESSADGAGELTRYEDKTEDIKASQVMAKKKIHAYPTKAGYRN